MSCVGAELAVSAYQTMTDLIHAALTGIADYPAFCVAVLVFLALPGPGTFALLTATGQGGWRSGAAATLGLILGDQLLLWAAVGGVAAVLAAWPMVFDVIRWAGALYLAWIGVRLLRVRSGQSASPVQMKAGHYTRQAWLITVLNPKAIAFYMAFFPLFLKPGQHPSLLTFSFMALTIAGLTAVWCLSLCACAHGLRTFFRVRPSLGTWLQRGAGACLIGFSWRLLRS